MAFDNGVSTVRIYFTRPKAPGDDGTWTRWGVHWPVPATHPPYYGVDRPTTSYLIVGTPVWLGTYTAIRSEGDWTGAEYGEDPERGWYIEIAFFPLNLDGVAVPVDLMDLPASVRVHVGGAYDITAAALGVWVDGAYVDLAYKPGGGWNYEEDLVPTYTPAEEPPCPRRWQDYVYTTEAVECEEAGDDDIVPPVVSEWAARDWAYAASDIPDPLGGLFSQGYPAHPNPPYIQGSSGVSQAFTGLEEALRVAGVSVEDSPAEESARFNMEEVPESLPIKYISPNPGGDSLIVQLFNPRTYSEPREVNKGSFAITKLRTSDIVEMLDLIRNLSSAGGEGLWTASMLCEVSIILPAIGDLSQFWGSNHIVAVPIVLAQEFEGEFALVPLGVTPWRPIEELEAFLGMSTTRGVLDVVFGGAPSWAWYDYQVHEDSYGAVASAIGGGIALPPPSSPINTVLGVRPLSLGVSSVPEVIQQPWLQPAPWGDEVVDKFAPTKSVSADSVGLVLTGIPWFSPGV